MESVDRKRKFLINILFFISVAFLGFFIYKYLIIYLMPFLIGIVLAYSVQKPAAKICFRHRKGIAAIIVVVCYLLIALIVYLLIYALYSNSQRIFGVMQSAFNYFSGVIDSVSSKYFFNTNGTEFINEIFQNLTRTFSSAIGSAAKGLPAILFTLIITIVSSCYFAVDFQRGIKFLKGFLSSRSFEMVCAIKRIVFHNVFKMIKGYAILAFITFIELLIGFFIIGIKNALIIAAVVALVDLLPLLGTGAVLLPWAVILFFNGSYFLGVELIILYLIITIIRNFAEPKILGSQIGIPPIINLVILFFGLKFFGFIGTVSLIITLVVLINLYKEKYIVL